MFPDIKPPHTHIERLLANFAKKDKPSIADFAALRTLGTMFDRPSNRCDAHALVSGAHPEAIVMRGVLAWLKVRIDDPHNGCWLPRDWDDQKHMPNYLRNAVPHKRIHTKNYYGWLSGRIRPGLINTPEQLIQILRMMRTMLQSGNVPPNVMPKTGR